MRLEVRGLTLRVGTRTLARDLSFDVGPGDCILVQGPSGSGKTRLLRALAGLDPVDGTLRLGGRPPEAWGWPAWRARITYVPQKVPPLPGSPRALHRALTQLGHGTLSDAPSALVKQWGMPAARLSDPWSELDPGEAQRALLALVVARDPAVLLLDEPTSALDEPTTLAVEQSLVGRARVWVTHDIDQAHRLLTAGARTVELEGTPEA